MAVVIYHKPKLENSIMFCGWPGIGNIGILAIDTLRSLLKAQEFAEIEPWDFFDPQKVIIEKGLLKEIEFPGNKFYYQRLKGSDVLFFIGQQQPCQAGAMYAQGQKAYQMANLVLEVAEKFGCRRVYTSGAAVTNIHHTAKSKVWAVPNHQNLINEIKQYQNTFFMSEIEAKTKGFRVRGSGFGVRDSDTCSLTPDPYTYHGVITGLNGLLLGVAKKRGLEAICLMGEIPYYLQTAPWPYPKASKAVLEVLTRILDVEINLRSLEVLTQKVEQNIEQFLENLYSMGALPPEIREEVEKLKYAHPAGPGPITEEEQKKMMDHVDELFDQEGRTDERHL